MLALLTLNELSPFFSIFADGQDFAFDPPVSEPSYFAFIPSSGYTAMQDRDRLQSTGRGFEREDNQDIFLPDGETFSSDHWDFKPPCLDAAWISSLSDLSPTSCHGDRWHPREQRWLQPTFIKMSPHRSQSAQLPLVGSMNSERKEQPLMWSSILLLRAKRR